MRALVACLALLALLAISPATALASPSQESMFQDDSRLVYGTPGTVEETLDVLRGLGVDRIRVSVFWRLVAPDGDSKQRPTFDAANPAAYPAAKWERYDRLVRAAAARGIALNLNVTSPAPLWATGRPSRSDIEETYDPNPGEFAQFVLALGRRYTGSFSPSVGQPPLPRVDYWSVWNEPNQAGWLTPQWGPEPSGSGRTVRAAPRIYRSLLDGAYAGLAGSGHGQDTILIGELAPKGLAIPGETRSIKALQFLRDLYCVDGRLRRLSGAAAASLGCPTGTPEEFVGAHPGLFLTTGFAHHPYSLLEPPSRPSRDRDFVTIADLPRLTRALDGIFRSYGRPGGIPIFLTEYGYQTNPPDPFGFTWRRQASFLNEGEFIAYRNPRVRAVAQFLLVDDAPTDGLSPTDPDYWGTFQTGLVARDGRRKPAFEAYRLPVWVPQRSKRRGQAFRVWALVRSANGTPQRVDLQFRSGRSRRAFRTIRHGTTSPEGFLDMRVRVPGNGELRAAWRDPAGLAVSRRVRLRLR